MSSPDEAAAADMSSPDEAAAPVACGDEDTPPASDKNSRDQVSVPEADLGQEVRERFGDPVISPRVPEGPRLIQGPLEIGEGEGSLPGPESSDLESRLKLEATEERGKVPKNPECRTASPVDQEEVDLDFLPQLSIEAVTVMQELANLQIRKVCRYPSPQTCAAELAALWGNKDEGSNRGALSLNSMKGKQASEGAPYPRGLGRGRAWVTSRRGTIGRMVSSEGVQYPSSNPVSSDEFSDNHMMKVTVCLKGDQARSSGLTELDSIARQTNVHGRGNFVHVPPSVLSSATWGLSSDMERQASVEPESSLSKKKPNIVWSKEWSRPSHQGTTAAAATASGVAPASASAASGALHKTSPKKKQAQEKNSSDVSRGSQGKNFPQWGHRLKSAPIAPATLPPISGVALLGKASKCSLPSGSREFKPLCTEKKSMAKRTRETQAGPKEDNSPRDPGLQAQVPPHRAEQPSVCMYRGDMSSGDSNTRAPQVPGNPQFLSLGQRCARPRAPAPAGDQELPLRLPFPVGDRQHPVQGIGGCQQCMMLQKEIDELKEQLAILQALNEKFQDL